MLAAAIHGGAQIIVTANIKDFPATVLARYTMTAREPDALVCEIIAADTHSALPPSRPTARA